MREKVALQSRLAEVTRELEEGRRQAAEGAERERKAAEALAAAESAVKEAQEQAAQVGAGSGGLGTAGDARGSGCSLVAAQLLRLPSCSPPQLLSSLPHPHHLPASAAPRWRSWARSWRPRRRRTRSWTRTMARCCSGAGLGPVRGGWWAESMTAAPEFACLCHLSPLLHPPTKQPTPRSLDELNDSLKRCQEQLKGAQAEGVQLAKTASVSAGGWAGGTEGTAGRLQSWLQQPAAPLLSPPTEATSPPAPHLPPPPPQAKEELVAEREQELAQAGRRIEALEQDVALKANMLKGISQARLGAGCRAWVGWRDAAGDGGWRRRLGAQPGHPLTSTFLSLPLPRTPSRWPRTWRRAAPSLLRRAAGALPSAVARRQRPPRAAPAAGPPRRCPSG